MGVNEQLLPVYGMPLVRDASRGRECLLDSPINKRVSGIKYESR